MAICPDEIRALPANLQPPPTVILQVPQRGDEPSHELEIAITVVTIISDYCPR